MSVIEENIKGLAHLDQQIALMRQGLAAIRDKNTTMADATTKMWGEGNGLAGPIAQALSAAEAKLTETDHALLLAQVTGVHAMSLLQQLAGQG